MSIWTSSEIVNRKPHSSSFGVHGRFAVPPPIDRNHAMAPVRRAAHLRRECNQSADEYMPGFYRRQPPNTQFPAPKASWELEVGNWALKLLGPRRKDLPEHVGLRHVSFEMRLARAATVVKAHCLHHIVVLHFPHQWSGRPL